MSYTKKIKHSFIKSGVGYVELSQGLYAQVNPELLPIVMQVSWSTAVDEYGYTWAQSSTFKRKLGKPVKLHHVIKGTPLPGYCVDYINGDPLDNRRVNLRVCTRLENAQNQTKVRGEIDYRGVCRNGKRYRAALTYGGERYNLGTYGTPEEAAAAYNVKALELRGEYASLNNVTPFALTA